VSPLSTRLVGRKDSLDLVCRPGDTRAESLNLFQERVRGGCLDEWS
jgi:hypothetical protein